MFTYREDSVELIGAVPREDQFDTTFCAVEMSVSGGVQAGRSLTEVALSIECSHVRVSQGD